MNFFQQLYTARKLCWEGKEVYFYGKKCLNPKSTKKSLLSNTCLVLITQLAHLYLLTKEHKYI